jgi:CP family cyanate transporter-like MFS transporter
MHLNTNSATVATTATAAHAHRITAIIGLLILSLALRPGIVSIGPILLQIQNEFALSYTKSSLLIAIPDICMGVFALFVPRIARTLGSDRAVITALVLLAAATLLRGLSASVTALLLTTLFVGIGIAVSGSLVGGWIKTHFPREASFFMGIYAAGLSVGASAAAVLTDVVARINQDWRWAAAMWSLLCVTAILSWRTLIKKFPSTDENKSTKSQATAIALPFRNGKAWMIALYFGISQFMVYACFAWIAPSSTEMNIPHISAGVLLALFTLTFAIASFAAGYIARHSTDRRGWLLFAMLLTAVGLVGLSLWPTSYAMADIILIAIGQGICFPLVMTLPLDNTVSSSDANLWTVFMLFIGYLIAALGPVCFGLLRDHTDGYGASYGLLTAASMLLLVMTPALKPNIRTTAIVA